jgi:hypothetical protein
MAWNESRFEEWESGDQHILNFLFLTQSSKQVITSIEIFIPFSFLLGDKEQN